VIVKPKTSKGGCTHIPAPMIRLCAVRTQRHPPTAHGGFTGSGGHTIGSFLPRGRHFPTRITELSNFANFYVAAEFVPMFRGRRCSGVVAGLAFFSRLLCHPVGPTPNHASTPAAPAKAAAAGSMVYTAAAHRNPLWANIGAATHPSANLPPQRAEQPPTGGQVR